MAEALLAKHMGKRRPFAETHTRQHGVALATAAAYFGLECAIQMAPRLVRQTILVNPSGRGDSDIDKVPENFGYAA